MSRLQNKTKSIKTFLLIFVVVVTVLIFAAQTGFSTIKFRGNIEDEISKKLEFQAGAEAEKLFSNIALVGKCTELQAYNVATLGYKDYEKLLDIAKKYVEENELACGSGIWLEPYIYDENTKYFGPYMYKENGEVEMCIRDRWFMV